MVPRLLNDKECAAAIGLDHATFRSMVEAGELPGPIVIAEKRLEVWSVEDVNGMAWLVAARVRFSRQKGESFPRSLRFDPGAFFYGDHREPLAGKSLEVLKAIHDAPNRVCAKKTIGKKVWDDITVDDRNIRWHVGQARAALKRAILTATGRKAAADPLKSIGKGEASGWRLILPSA